MIQNDGIDFTVRKEHIVKMSKVYIRAVSLYTVDTTCWTIPECMALVMRICGAMYDRGKVSYGSFAAFTSKVHFIALADMQNGETSFCEKIWDQCKSFDARNII